MHRPVLLSGRPLIVGEMDEERTTADLVQDAVQTFRSGVKELLNEVARADGTHDAVALVCTALLQECAGKGNGLVDETNSVLELLYGFRLLAMRGMQEEGKSYAEIGAVLGISRVRVGQLLTGVGGGQTQRTGRPTGRPKGRRTGQPGTGSAAPILTAHAPAAFRWDAVRNLPMTPDDVAPNARRLFWWICELDHPQKMSFARASAAPSCRRCRDGEPGAGTDLASTHPEVAHDWQDPTGFRSPQMVRPDSQVTVCWLCPTGHKATMSVADRVGMGCPGCSATPMIDIRRQRPDLVDEYVAGAARAAGGDKDKQLVELPHYYLPGSRMHGTFPWQCRACSHRWDEALWRRIDEDSGCPRCTSTRWLRRSREEIHLSHELAAFLPVDKDAHLVPDATGRQWDCDVVIKALRLIVEYDGAYWHSSPEKTEIDTRKTASLQAAGWAVLRVRERPLPDLPGTWSVSADGGDYHRTAAAVLSALAAHDGAYLSSDAASAYERGGVLLRAAEARAEIEQSNALRRNQPSLYEMPSGPGPTAGCDA